MIPDLTDADSDYDLYDYWLPVNYGWVTEPTQPAEGEGVRQGTSVE